MREKQFYSDFQRNHMKSKLNKKHYAQQCITAITAIRLRPNPLGIANVCAKPKNLRTLTRN